MLSVAFLRHEGECHGVRSCCGSLIRTVFSVDRCLAWSTAHRQWNVEHRLSLEFPGFNALSHHLRKLSVEFSLSLWVTLLHLTGNNNVFAKVRVRFGITVCQGLLLCLVNSSSYYHRGLYLCVNLFTRRLSLLHFRYGRFVFVSIIT